MKCLGELSERNEFRLNEILKPFSDVLLDGTERPIQQPQDENLKIFML
ncbi:MAG TPA: hypothetical protein PLE52_03640 [Paludibacteraceae bacterium]|nr:hypothetical protein [Paludibacteraceae bacterium]